MQNLITGVYTKYSKDSIKYDSVVKTDNYSSYSKIKDNVWCHIPQKVRPKDAGKVLPWVHTMISNAKRTLLGVHHMISTKYAQNYLDEFCYKVTEEIMVTSCLTDC